MTEVPVHIPSPARDLSGYGATPPDFRWPNGAGLALNFVVNVEEGSEASFAAGDGRTEKGLTEVRGARVPETRRDLAAESMFEYGSRVGFWRLYRLFRERNLPVTIFACALALERVPEIAAAISATDWDICAHGLRWEEHYLLAPEAEAVRIAEAHASILKSVGRAPQGWYCRYAPSGATRALVVRHGAFLYDSDAYNDDLPYWVRVGDAPHLVVPYTMVTNDAKFGGGDVFTGRDFADFLIDSFDLLLEESATRTRMMSVGLHPRVIGHPGRIAGLVRFLDHVSGRDDVWICGRAELAAHFAATLPASEALP